jgi:beta-glucosidase
MKRHEEILAAPGRAEARVVFIGDSITDGWDAEGKGLKVWQKEYVPMKALNLGVNCDSTQHVLWRLDHGEVDGLPKLKAAVIEIGTNNEGITRDPPEGIAKGVEAICGRLKQKAPRAKILLLVCCQF